MTPLAKQNGMQTDATYFLSLLILCILLLCVFKHIVVILVVEPHIEQAQCIAYLRIG